MVSLSDTFNATSRIVPFLDPIDYFMSNLIQDHKIHSHTVQFERRWA